MVGLDRGARSATTGRPSRWLRRRCRPTSGTATRWARVARPLPVPAPPRAAPVSRAATAAGATASTSSAPTRSRSAGDVNCPAGTTGCCAGDLLPTPGQSMQHDRRPARVVLRSQLCRSGVRRRRLRQWRDLRELSARPNLRPQRASVRGRRSAPPPPVPPGVVPRTAPVNRGIPSKPVARVGRRA